MAIECAELKRTGNRMEKDLCKAITNLLRIADGIYFQRLKDETSRLGL
jgi:hypothetical protein